MQALVEEHGEITVVTLSGRVELECIDSFGRACTSIFSQKKVVFDLKGLNFVGSTGLTPFMQTLGQLVNQTTGDQPRFVGLSSEFRRLFAGGHLKTAKVYSDRILAFNSFYFEPDDLGFVD